MSDNKQDLLKVDVAVLLTCFNRVNKTLAFLATLESQKLDVNINIDVYLVDDASTDGTYEQVAMKFPGVNIIKSDGDLYWCGGMRLAWKTAMKGNDYDYYILANDDIELNRGAINRLLSVAVENDSNMKVGALIGSMVGSNGKVSYSGRKVISNFNKTKYGPAVEPADECKLCDVANANLLLVPSASVDECGILSEEYTHCMGDFDYSYRLKDAGLNIVIAPGYYGVCEPNEMKSNIHNADLPIEERVALLDNPVQIPPVDEWMFFTKNHAGAAWPLIHIKCYIRKLFPEIFVRWFL